MTTKVLYSEIQPIALITCNCRESEPFLMMFRAFDQLIECGHCNTSYGVECKGNEMRAVERARTKAAAKAN